MFISPLSPYSKRGRQRERLGEGRKWEKVNENMKKRENKTLRITNIKQEKRIRKKRGENWEESKGRHQGNEKAKRKK